MEKNISTKKTLWISICHPLNIISAVGLAIYLRDKYVVNLLISEMPFWDGMGDKFYRQYFSSIIRFPSVGFSKHFLREILKILYIQRILKKIEIKQGDIFLALDHKSFLDNIFLSNFSHLVRSIKLTSVGDLRGTLKDYLMYNINYKEIITSKIWNWTIIPFFKLRSVVQLNHKTDTRVFQWIYKNGEDDMYDKCLIIKDYDSVLAKVNEVYNFMSIVQEILNKQKKDGVADVIVFFGEGKEYFDQFHFDFTNKCLRYIENFFPGHTYVFKSHPQDVNHYEAGHVDLGKFSLYQGRDVAQLFLLNNIEKVKYCFTLISTSCKASLDLGIPAYFFFKLYNYSEEYYNLILQFVKNINEDAFIASFDNPPNKYEISTNNIEKFNNEIYKLGL